MVHIVAHRGDSKHYLENTVPAFEAAWVAGADAIEGDFRCTQDGHIVCVHDDSIKRILGKELSIEASTLQQLQVYKHEDGTPVIPLLDYILRAMPAETGLYIDVKSGVRIVPLLLECLYRHRVGVDGVYIMSFKQSVLQALCRLRNVYKSLLIIDEMQVVHSSAFVQRLQGLGAVGVCASHRIRERYFIEAIIEAGYEYHVWTVDTAEQARFFQSMGVTSINCNDPAALRSWLTD